MSLVVAIKDKNRVVFGSDKQASTGCNKSHDTTKIWRVRDFDEIIMGGVGSMRASQIIQHSPIIDFNAMAEEGGICTNFIINSIIPALVGQLRGHGIVCGNSVEGKEESDIMIPNVFFLAYEDKAWMIWHDLSVSELDDYLAIGSGSDVAMGALFATQGKNPFTRIVTCIDAAAESTLYVDNGVDFLATKYYPKDDEMIMNALCGVDTVSGRVRKKETATNKVEKKNPNNKEDSVTDSEPIKPKKPVKKDKEDTEKSKPKSKPEKK